MEIILLRHGETEWNAIRKYQGQTDISLNDRGRAQVQRAARYILENEQIEAIYCSDLSRTRQTAEIAAECLEMEIGGSDCRLREVSFGIWEGLTYNEVQEKYRSEFVQWYKDVWNYKVPGGENFTEVAERSCQAIREISREHSGTVLVVTHGGVVNALIGTIDPSIDIWQTGINPASMTYIEFNHGKFRLLKTGFIAP